MSRLAKKVDVRLFPIFVFALNLLIIQEIRAETATPAEMEIVCRNWLAHVVHERGGWGGDPQPTIREVRDLIGDQGVLARCYSISPRGHVVVPVLKDLPPVKVYSEDCGLDVTERAGFAGLLREVLEKYARVYTERYGSLGASVPRGVPAPFGAGHRANWDRFTLDPPAFRRGLDEGRIAPRAEVGPLLTTAWHQREPYNDYCPIGDGGRCKVGCLATALAQIMKYHQWPPTGIGEKGYAWYGDFSCGGSTEGGWLSANFSDPYDWANMPDACDDPPCNSLQDAALAELSYEVGVAFEMAYGYCGSGPMTLEVATIMSTYFRYDSSIVSEERVNHTVESWFAMIQGEIDDGRPVLYLIQTQESGIGHAVVCDGWSDDAAEDRYHINYGWGGSYTGWYAIDEIHNTYDPMVEILFRQIMPGTGFVFQVAPDGGGYYATIQEAIDNVLHGDIIELADGIFSGPGNRDIDFHGKTVTVRAGNGDPTTCIVDCGGNPDEHRGFCFVAGEGPESVLESVTIRNGYVTGRKTGAGILCGEGSSPTIRNCILLDNNASGGGGGGISCLASSPLIERCIFAHNAADQAGGAVLAREGAQPTIASCTLFGNRAPAGRGAGIYLSSPATIRLDRCIIVESVDGEAVCCDPESALPILECCDLYGNAGGDWGGCIADQLGVNGNISGDPLFCDPSCLDFHVQVESPCSPEGNPICGLIGAEPVGCRHLVVRPDGTGDFPSIAAAIEAAGESDFVDLANGVYVGEGNRDLDFQGRRITVRSQSGNPDSCIIDCQGTPDDRHRAFHFHSGERANSRLEGVKIINGCSGIYSGGAIWCDGGSSPSITNCIFSNNQSEASGGAIWCSRESGPAISYCLFNGNAAGHGGAIFAHSSEPMIRNCTIVGNRADFGGAAIYTASCVLAVDNTIVAFNTGAPAVRCSEGGAAFRCCDIYGNSAGDWTECAAGQDGVDGNICLNPVFCDAANLDFRLAECSPCAPNSPQNPECDLVGAYPVGCYLASVSGGENFIGRLGLGPGVPNPFSESTRIAYFLPGESSTVPVRLSIFDSGGRLVRTLVDARQSGRTHMVRWDGRNDRLSASAAGIYFYRLEVNGESLTRSVVLIK